MRGVAVEAGYSAGEMDRTTVIAMVFAGQVTGKTAGTGFLRSYARKSEDFGFVSATVDVSFPGTMTGFATVPARAFVRVQVRIQGGGKVCGSCEILRDLLVARGTGIRADI